MAAGQKFNLKPEYKQEEFYRVDTGVRKSGPWKLDIANLVVGSVLPVFTPVQADLKKRTIVPVRNMKVVEAYTTGESALSIKIAKGSLAYIGMFVGSGKKGAEVTAIDKSNANYDVLTIKPLLARISLKMRFCLRLLRLLEQQRRIQQTLSFSMKRK